MKTNVLVTGTGRDERTTDFDQKTYLGLFTEGFSICASNFKGYFGTALIDELVKNDFEVTAFGSVEILSGYSLMILTIFGC